MALTVGRAIPAAATTNHSALVVVDTGSKVDAITVHFTTDTITGRQALDLTGLPVVYQPYGSMGDAVCAIEQVGCDAGQACLTCGGGHYWAYSHANAGADRFTATSKGVSSSQVHDGDEEGWKWGKGEPPAYVQQASPSASSTSTTTDSGAATTATGRGGVTSSTAGAKATTVGPAPLTNLARPGAAGATTSTSADVGGNNFALPRPSPTSIHRAPTHAKRSSPSRGRGGGSPLPGLLTLAAVLTGLSAIGLRARAQRARSS